MATYINGTKVKSPTGPGELCHHFVALWLQAKGKLPGGTKPESINAHTAGNVFFPGGLGLPARRGGRIEVVRDSVIGFYEGGQLMHSMIAISPITWTGSRNENTFEAAGNRVVFHNVHEMTNPGWLGPDHIWQSTMFRNGLSVWFRSIQ